jgi:hypothetical protein
MFDSNKYSESCSFSEQIVSFIYDEMSEQEKSAFVNHSSKCVVCSEELSAFGTVHSEIVDWKRQEFLPLQTPEVRIPYVTVAQEAKKPLFAGFFEFFSFSQVWVKTTTAFAMLVIFSGIAFFVFNSETTDGTMAKQAVPISSPKPLPTADVKVPETTILEPEVVVNPKSPNAPVKPVQANARIKSNNKPVSSTPKVEKATVRTTNSKPKVKRQQNVNLIESDEDEDDSLRLSDLFDEISMK